MNNPQPHNFPRPQDDLVLTKAFFRAGELLQMSQKDLSRILGVSEPTLSRLVHKGQKISPENKEGEIALLFLRLFRSLDALFGGRETDMRKWFDAHNRYLNGIPRDHVRSLQGLFDVVTYLDAMRGQA